MKKTKTILALVLNVLIVAFTTYSVINIYSATAGFGIGTSCFIYFTIQSNIFVSICAIIAVIFIVKNKNSIYPEWFSLIKFAATSAVMLTFVTVMGFLGLIYSYKLMLAGGNLFLHLITPLVALITFCFFENEPELKKQHVFVGVLPTIAYGLLYISCVYILKIWVDFYQFNLNGLWYVILPGMIVISTLVSLGILCLRKLIKY